MSSMGVGNSADMTLGSKLLGGAVPSCTWKAAVKRQERAHEQVTCHASNALEFFRVAVCNTPVQHAVKRLQHGLSVVVAVV